MIAQDGVGVKRLLFIIIFIIMLVAHSRLG